MSLEYCITKARQIPYVKGIQRIYSVMVDKKGRIVAESPNMMTKSHPLQKKYSLLAGLDRSRVMMHSELRSVILSKGKGTKIYVARVGSDGRPLDAIPCPSCRMALNEAGIKQIECTMGN